MKFRTLSLYSQMSFDNLCGEFYFPRLDTTLSTLDSLPTVPVGIFLTILMIMSAVTFLVILKNGEILTYY